MKVAFTSSLALVVLSLGCGNYEHESIEEAVCAARSTPWVIGDASLWIPVPLADDPFSDQAEGDPVVCQPIHYGPELEGEVLWFGIDTRDCGYITLRQPLPETLCPGDTVELRLWHFALTDAPFGYRAFLAFDRSTPAWQEEITPPATGMTVEGEFRVQKQVERGTPLYFHLSNHGTNSWGLLDIVATRPTVEP
jgi:hypothetical protein